MVYADAWCRIRRPLPYRLSSEFRIDVYGGPNILEASFPAGIWEGLAAHPYGGVASAVLEWLLRRRSQACGCWANYCPACARSRGCVHATGLDQGAGLINAAPIVLCRTRIPGIGHTHETTAFATDTAPGPARATQPPGAAAPYTTLALIRNAPRALAPGNAGIAQRLGLGLQIVQAMLHHVADADDAGECHVHDCMWRMRCRVIACETVSAGDTVITPWRMISLTGFEVAASPCSGKSRERSRARKRELRE